MASNKKSDLPPTMEMWCGGSSALRSDLPACSPRSRTGITAVAREGFLCDGILVFIAVGIEVGVAGPVLDLMDQGLIAPH